MCFFVCSGSEANELALRMARAHTGGDQVIVVEGAYHGNTRELVDISPDGRFVALNGTDNYRHLLYA